METVRSTYSEDERFSAIQLGSGVESVDDWVRMNAQKRLDVGKVRHQVAHRSHAVHPQTHAV